MSEPKTVIGEDVKTTRRILRVTGMLGGSGKIVTHDYHLPCAVRLFKTKQDIRTVAGEFYRINSAEVLDEHITTRTNTTKIV